MNPTHDDHLRDGVLRHLRENGTSDLLREMARDVLDGRITLAEGVASSVDSAALEDSATGFFDWYHELEAEDQAAEPQAVSSKVAEPHAGSRSEN